jgi:hypothetical protein
MRVVTFQELCALPSGAIFSAFSPNIVEGLYRRGALLPSGENADYYRGPAADFFYRTLFAEVDHNKVSKDPKDQQFRPIGSTGRWGNFDPDELFVLYEPDDIRFIVGQLRGAIPAEGE